MTTFFDIQKIINTIPIGYYAKRNIDLVLDETEDCSFYDMLNDKILISYPQLMLGINKLADMKNIESDVRTLVYHEVSHAILTPRTLHVDNKTNIFEDERIETVLNTFYMNTNFKDFIKRVADYDSSKTPKNFDEAFFYLVRFRQGSSEFLRRVELLIEKYSTMNHSSRYSYHYSSDIEQLYREYKQYLSDNGAIKDNLIDQSTFGQLQKQSISPESEQATNNDCNQDAVRQEQSGNTTSKTNENNIATQAFVAAVNSNINTTMIEKVSKIFDSIRLFEKQNAAAINSYSGRFNSRSAARDDYRLFLQENRIGTAKQNSKINMILVIDNSGSFSGNDAKINELLYALKTIERRNSNFKFELITCNDRNILRDKNKFIFRSTGANDITANLPKAVAAATKRDYANINLVLFDGDMLSNSVDRETSMSHFECLNNSRTYIISDPDNKNTLRKCAKRAHVTISTNYVRELESAVFKVLQSLR